MCVCVGTCGKLWEHVGAYENLWELVGTYGNLWELVGTYGNLWELMGTCGNLWELMRPTCMGTYGNLWELLRTNGNKLHFILFQYLFSTCVVIFKLLFERIKITISAPIPRFKNMQFLLLFKGKILQFEHVQRKRIFTYYGLYKENGNALNQSWNCRRNCRISSCSHKFPQVPMSSHEFP